MAKHCFSFISQRCFCEKMTKTLMESKCNPKYKISITNNNTRSNNSTPPPSNLQTFKNKLLSGNGFVVYKQS